MLTHLFSGATFPAGPGWCFFFLLRPRVDAHSLTAGLGGDASRRGGAFLFLLRPRPDRGGVCLFFCCGPARTLTHSLWAGAISARPGWCWFFLRCGPVEPGEPIRTNVWCTTSGLKRPGGATAKKKKKHHFLDFSYLQPYRGQPKHPKLRQHKLQTLKPKL